MPSGKDEIKQKISENLFKAIPRAMSKTKRFRSDVWEIFYKIFDDHNTLVPNYFFCKTCADVIFNEVKNGKSFNECIFCKYFHKVDYNLINMT